MSGREFQQLITRSLKKCTHAVCILALKKLKYMSASDLTRTKNWEWKRPIWTSVDSLKKWTEMSGEL